MRINISCSIGSLLRIGFVLLIVGLLVGSALTE
jgi:hypothetical protein